MIDGYGIHGWVGGWVGETYPYAHTITREDSYVVVAVFWEETKLLFFVLRRGALRHD